MKLMSLKNVSYAVGLWPAIKIATLVHGFPAIGAIVIGAASLVAWVAFVRWASK